MHLRIGFGVDVHRLEEGLPLIIGGIKINSTYGAVGHSDADVLLHAVADAVLGAANLRDIGYHFPDTDKQYEGMDSRVLLSEVMNLVHVKGFKVINLDCTVILESPKLSPYHDEIQETIADLLGVTSEDISIKATTHEKVDSFGELKAIKAYAACLLQKG